MLPWSLNLHYDNHPEKTAGKLGSARGQRNASKFSYRTENQRNALVPTCHASLSGKKVCPSNQPPETLLVLDLQS
jgi:hypothetical protein